MMENGLEMPATVAAYLKDPAVRAAVDALLAVDAGTLSPGLEMEELDGYYRARGGAELTRHDMAYFLRQLWKKIWGERIGPQWDPAPLEELIDYNYAVTPEQVWDEKSFTVYHYQRPYVLYTDVRLEPQALSIAFSIEQEDSEEILIDGKFPPFRWSEEGNKDWSGWQVLQTGCEPRGSLPDLAPILDAARAAYAATESAVAAHRKR